MLSFWQNDTHPSNKGTTMYSGSDLKSSLLDDSIGGTISQVKIDFGLHVCLKSRFNLSGWIETRLEEKRAGQQTVLFSDTAELKYLTLVLIKTNILVINYSKF